MPHSASGTITQALARLLDIPVLRVTLGRFPQHFLAPAWLEMFLEGGAIAQDHFPASDFNSGVLAHRGKLDVFVTVRDPRAAAHSAARRAQRSDGASFEEAVAKECITDFVPWLQSWIARAQDPDTPFKVHWLAFREIRSDLPAAVRRVCSVEERDHPALRRLAQASNLEAAGDRGTTDDDNAWRSDVDDSCAAEMWAACTPDIRALLALQS